MFCGKCKKKCDWLDGDHVVDAWVKDDHQFFNVECDCGHVQTLKFRKEKAIK